MKNQFLTLALCFMMSSLVAQQKKEIRYLALGDSYTIGESVAENERWPVQLAERLRKAGMPVHAPRIIATTGWRTDDLKNAIVDAHLKNEYQLVSLLIGVNNQYQGKPAAQYALEFEELLKMSIALAEGKKENVFVVSIPDYGFTPYGAEKKESISKALDEFNAINKAITNKYDIQYINITDISREAIAKPELVAGDGLHPSARMYTLWVDRMVDEIPFRRK